MFIFIFLPTDTDSASMFHERLKEEFEFHCSVRLVVAETLFHKINSHARYPFYRIFYLPRVRATRVLWSTSVLITNSCGRQN
jgi:hypothetical protein